MPWHTVYFAVSMAPLGGWWLGKVIDGIDWAAGRKRGIFWLMGMVPLFLIALKALLPTSSRKPFSDVTVNGLSNSAQWLLALILGARADLLHLRPGGRSGWETKPARSWPSAWRRSCCSSPSGCPTASTTSTMMMPPSRWSTPTAHRTSSWR